MKIKKIIRMAFLVIICLQLSGELHAKDKFLKNFSGSLSNHYRLRTTGSVSDSDLETIATLNFGDPGYQKVTGALQAGGIFDLDGGQVQPYRSIYDTFNTRAVGRLYFAYINIQKIKPFELIKLGRQHHNDFENFYFDGVSIDSNPYYGFKLSAYAGVPVHLFESQFGASAGDYIVGEAISWTPIKSVRLRFDHALIKDKASTLRIAQGNQKDNLIGTTVWVDILSNWDAYARFTTFDDQARDFTFASTFRLPKHDLRIGARVYRLLQGYDIRVPELDAYSIVGTYLPYTEFALNVTKGVGKHILVDSGFNWRKLDDRQMVTAFNHGYKRGYLSVTTSDLLHKGLTFSATGDYYHGEDSVFRNDYFGGSFFASQQLLKKKLTITAGTAYYLYKFNLATGNESSNVQTYFAKVEGKITKNLRVKCGYEFENNDFNGYHTLDLSLIGDF